MDASASYRNMFSSIEKFLWDGIAQPNSRLLIDQDDIATRLSELEAAGRSFVWRLQGGSAGNTGRLKLFVGATYVKDPGNIGLYTLFDKVKELFDVSASIVIYDYAGGNPTTKVNELSFVTNPVFWPVIREPNGYKTLLLSQELMFAQKRV